MLLLMRNLVSVEQVRNLRHVICILCLFVSTIAVLMSFCFTVAGRSAKENVLFTEVTEGINSYSITRHRHGKLIRHVILDLCTVFKCNYCVAGSV